LSAEVEFEFMDEDPIAFTALLQNANASDIEEVAEEGLLPILGVVIAAVIAINALSNVIVRLTRLWSCGIIVDARTSTIHTKKNCDLPRGTVLVFAPDGTRHQLHEPTETDLAKLIGGPIGKLATS
jgi:hypothetical protein